jgi:hypothetical protein
MCGYHHQGVAVHDFTLELLLSALGYGWGLLGLSLPV